MKSSHIWSMFNYTTLGRITLHKRSYDTRIVFLFLLHCKTLFSFYAILTWRMLLFCIFLFYKQCANSYVKPVSFKTFVLQDRWILAQYTQCWVTHIFGVNVCLHHYGFNNNPNSEVCKWHKCIHISNICVCMCIQTRI